MCVLGFSEKTWVLSEHAVILLPDKEGRIQLWLQKAILSSREGEELGTQASDVGGGKTVPMSHSGI